MSEIAARLVVEGRVQGVGYRYWAMAEARRWPIRGWVRNRADGTVEILCIGAADAVEQFTARCGDGPAQARVLRVNVFPAADDGSLGFEARATL